MTEKQDMQCIDLKKNLSIWKSVGLVVGSVLGSGLMILPGLVYSMTGVYSFYSWIGMGALLIPFLYVFARIMKQYPSSGGLVNVIYQILGHRFGVAISYISIISLVLLVPILTIVSANYLCYLCQLPASSNVIIAWILLLLITYLNTFDSKISLRIQGISSVILLCLLIMIIVVALLSTDVAHLSTALEAPAWNLDSIYLVILGMNLVFWAFLGWENLSFATEEFVDIKKDFNKVIVISFLIMMFLYLGLSASVVALLDKESMQTVMVPLAAVAHEVLGSYSAYVVAGVAFLILLININAWVWGPSRLMYDSGRKKIIPEFFAKLNHNNAPQRALYILMIFYTLVLLVMYFVGDALVTILIQQVNCVFLILYMSSMIAFIKDTEKPILKAVGAFAALLIAVFLLGFKFYLILPCLVLIWGYIREGKNKDMVKESMESKS